MNIMNIKHLSITLIYFSINQSILLQNGGGRADCESVHSESKLILLGPVYLIRMWGGQTMSPSAAVSTCTFVVGMCTFSNGTLH